MKIKLKKQVEQIVEREVEFPLYFRLTIDNESAGMVDFYWRVQEDVVHELTITTKYYPKALQYEFEQRAFSPEYSLAGMLEGDCCEISGIEYNEQVARAVAALSVFQAL